MTIDIEDYSKILSTSLKKTVPASVTNWEFHNAEREQIKKLQQSLNEFLRLEGAAEILNATLPPRFDQPDLIRSVDVTGVMDIKTQAILAAIQYRTSDERLAQAKAATRAQELAYAKENKLEPPKEIKNDPRFEKLTPALLGDKAYFAMLRMTAEGGTRPAEMMRDDAVGTAAQTLSFMPWVNSYIQFHTDPESDYKKGQEDMPGIWGFKALMLENDFLADDQLNTKLQSMPLDEKINDWRFGLGVQKLRDEFIDILKNVPDQYSNVSAWAGATPTEVELRASMTKLMSQPNKGEIIEQALLDLGAQFQEGHYLPPQKSDGTIYKLNPGNISTLWTQYSGKLNATQAAEATNSVDAQIIRFVNNIADANEAMKVNTDYEKLSVAEKLPDVKRITGTTSPQDREQIDKVLNHLRERSTGLEGRLKNSQKDWGDTLRFWDSSKDSISDEELAFTVEFSKTFVAITDAQRGRNAIALKPPAISSRLNDPKLRGLQQAIKQNFPNIYEMKIGGQEPYYQETLATASKIADPSMEIAHYSNVASRMIAQDVLKYMAIDSGFAQHISKPPYNLTSQKIEKLRDEKFGPEHLILFQALTKYPGIEKLDGMDSARLNIYKSYAGLTADDAKKIVAEPSIALDYNVRKLAAATGITLGETTAGKPLTAAQTMTAYTEGVKNFQQMVITNHTLIANIYAEYSNGRRPGENGKPATPLPPEIVARLDQEFKKLAIEVKNLDPEIGKAGGYPPEALKFTKEELDAYLKDRFKANGHLNGGQADPTATISRILKLNYYDSLPNPDTIGLVQQAKAAPATPAPAPAPRPAAPAAKPSFFENIKNTFAPDYSKKSEGGFGGFVKSVAANAIAFSPFNPLAGLNMTRAVAAVIKDPSPVRAAVAPVIAQVLESRSPPILKAAMFIDPINQALPQIPRTQTQAIVAAQSTSRSQSFVEFLGSTRNEVKVSDALNKLLPEGKKIPDLTGVKSADNAKIYEVYTALQSIDKKRLPVALARDLQKYMDELDQTPTFHTRLMAYQLTGKMVSFKSTEQLFDAGTTLEAKQALKKLLNNKELGKGLLAFDITPENAANAADYKFAASVKAIIDNDFNWVFDLQPAVYEAAKPDYIELDKLIGQRISQLLEQKTLTSEGIKGVVVNSRISLLSQIGQFGLQLTEADVKAFPGIFTVENGQMTLSEEGVAKIIADPESVKKLDDLIAAKKKELSPELQVELEKLRSKIRCEEWARQLPQIYSQDEIARINLGIIAGVNPQTNQVEMMTGVPPKAYKDGILLGLQDPKFIERLKQTPGVDAARADEFGRALVDGLKQMLILKNAYYGDPAFARKIDAGANSPPPAPNVTQSFAENRGTEYKAPTADASAKVADMRANADDVSRQQGAQMADAGSGGQRLQPASGARPG